MTAETTKTTQTKGKAKLPVPMAPVGIDPDVMEMHKRPILDDDLRTASVHQDERLKLEKHYNKASDGIYRHFWAPEKMLDVDFLRTRGNAEVIRWDQYGIEKMPNEGEEGQPVRFKTEVLLRRPDREVRIKEEAIGLKSRERKLGAHAAGENAVKSVGVGADGDWNIHDTCVRSYDRKPASVELREEKGQV